MKIESITGYFNRFNATQFLRGVSLGAQMAAVIANNTMPVCSMIFIAMAPAKIYLAYREYRTRVKRLRTTEEKKEICYRIVKVAGKVGNVVYELLKPLALASAISKGGFLVTILSPALKIACPVIIAISAGLDIVATIWSLGKFIQEYRKLTDRDEILRARITLLKKVTKLIIAITVLVAAILLLTNPYSALPAGILFVISTALGFIPPFIPSRHSAQKSVELVESKV